ncbi:ATP-binding cassette domain-containing protein [Pseudomonas sp. RA_15y_Pfl1_P11]|uniref:ATP-binding cassette domain-containing protein n=1 Tax=Pseudomonas sp. RA_15y_Pfl1_P11 TaxID=3088702 RepID=UPI0030D7E557
MGENGAGKSTLIKILSGAYVRNMGGVSLNGEKVDIRNPGDTSNWVLRSSTRSLPWLRICRWPRTSASMIWTRARDSCSGR